MTFCITQFQDETLNIKKASRFVNLDAFFNPIILTNSYFSTIPFELEIWGLPENVYFIY